MKTVIEIIKKEIAELWSSPGDNPNYTQIFEVIERNESLFKQQIIEAFDEGFSDNGLKYVYGKDYYNETFTTNK